MQRRKFFKSVAAGGLGIAISPIAMAMPQQSAPSVQKPATNIADAIAIPRKKHSMPGLYPGKVVKTTHSNCIVEGMPSEQIAYDMLKSGMLNLTGEKELKNAWLRFVGPKDIIGLKVNPVAGKLLTTSHAVTKAIIKQLEESGIPRKNIIIWDRREMQLPETGYTPENYPGIKITGTECQDEAGGFFNKEGKLYSEERVDKKHFFFADVEEDYDAYTLPYMVNKGKYSYFAKLCTETCTKIINVPILKNAGSSVTLCMKNLAFGSISNTGRLHKNLWHETSAYVCAFPPLRDKVVLNIVDGLIGCFEGGPTANLQYICQYKTLLLGSDPVAVDRIGYEMVMEKRKEEGIQKEEKAGSRLFMELAQNLKLGIADRDKIQLIENNLA